MKLIAWIIFADLLIPLCANASEEWCAPGVPRHSVHSVTGKSCPFAGNIGGVKLAIPAHYILGPIAYKGIDIWNTKSYKNTTIHPTFDNELDNFAIKIRQTNFKPVESEKDIEDLAKLGRTSRSQQPENRWIYVGVDAHRYIRTGGNFKLTYQNWLKDDAHRGPFNKEPDTWGLEHFVSVQPISGISGQEKHEFLYDSQTQMSFIHCTNNLRHVPPFGLLSSCELEFIIPEINALISVSNIQVRDDLANWRKFEAGIRQVLRSFIVP